jgi:release factor glutamine methyltransferase
MTRLDALRWIVRELTPVAGTCAGFEADLLLQHALGISRHDCYTHGNASLHHAHIDTLRTWIGRRLAHEPLAYILGTWTFHACTLHIDRCVLIPRPETEVLVETVLAHEPREPLYFCDIGTGSGNITAALCRGRPRWRALAVDISSDALRCAARNLSHYAYTHDASIPAHAKNEASGCMLAVTDLLHGIFPRHQFDICVSNPPYISLPDMNALDTSVAGFEPSQALYGGEDGMDFYRRLARMLPHYLVEDGRLYCEIGAESAAAVRTIFSSCQWRHIRIFTDMNDRERVLVAVAPAV